MGVLVLIGGEQDGLEVPGISAQECPHIFYAVSIADQDKIRTTRGNNAKRELRDRLAYLAYQYDPLVSTHDRFVMRRRADLDKKVAH